MNGLALRLRMTNENSDEPGRGQEDGLANWIVESPAGWSTLLQFARFSSLRERRPDLIQYPKFHWEFWQSLLLAARRFY